MRAGGDYSTEVLIDEGLTGASESAGEVVRAVLDAEVPDQDLPLRAGGGEAGLGDALVGQAGPRGPAGPVELALQPLAAGSGR